MGASVCHGVTILLLQALGHILNLLVFIQNSMENISDILHLVYHDGIMIIWSIYV